MAGGQQINSGQGTITFEGAGATDALTGSAATTDSGSTAQGTSIRLRSRKVGGGAASFLLTGQFSTVQQEAPVKQVSALLSTPATTGAQGSFTRTHARSLSGILVQIAQTSIGDQSGSWDINAISFINGTAGSSQLPVPSGYTTGGFFQVVTGTLPTGVTLSDSGLLSYDGVGAVASASITFSYTEPGAISTLTLNSTGAGTFPYMATIYPTEGAVPSGQILLSPNDSTFRSSVLSTWPDGSAQVIVGAGRKAVSANSTATVKLRPGSPSGTNMTTNDLVSVVNTVAVNFGTPLSLTLTTTNHDRIWWQNPEVICCRYRLPITNKGSMEAVIDVHCFQGGRAFVEVVIENCKLSSSSPVAPDPQAYSGASVSVNGTPIASLVDDPTPNGAKYVAGTHERFRAWYCSGWIGGDPGIAVTHDTVSLQAHPMFFRPARTSTYNFATQVFSSSGNGHQDVINQPYGSDAYSPWWCGRQRDAGMGASAADPTISMFPQWEEQYIQSGDKNVRNAVIQNTLAVLSFGINYRDSVTNDVTNPESVRTRFRYSGTGTQSDNWPYLSDTTYPGWEFAHQPAVGLMAFLCRPSPCFIEIAQKVALWNATSYLDSITYYQTRAIAWAMRNVGHAIFLTPDAQSTLKAGFRGVLTRNLTRIVNGFVNSSNNPLQLLMDSWSVSVSSFKDLVTSDRGFTQSLWMHAYCSATFHLLANGKVLRGADETLLNTVADWSSQYPIRWINEQPNGGWRYIRHFTEVGVNGGDRLDIGQYPTWTQQIAWLMGNDNPPSVGGSWYTCTFGNDPTAYTFTGPDWFPDPGSGLDYVDRYWMALCCAVERGVSGADTAWSTVTNPTTGMTTLSTWLNQFATNNQYGWYPRNK